MSLRGHMTNNIQLEVLYVLRIFNGSHKHLSQLKACCTVITQKIYNQKFTLLKMPLKQQDYNQEEFRNGKILINSIRKCKCRHEKEFSLCGKRRLKLTVAHVCKIIAIVCGTQVNLSHPEIQMVQSVVMRTYFPFPSCVSIRFLH